MKYFNKDYANFVISDEMERKLQKEKGKKYFWYLDPEYNEAYKKSQERFKKYGMVSAFFWAGFSILNLFLAIHYYNSSRPEQWVFALYLVVCLCGGLLAVYYYFAVKKARVEEANKPGKAPA